MSGRDFQQCPHCTDPNGEPCYPIYGLAPREMHGGETFREDPDVPGCGTWYCPVCRAGMFAVDGAGHCDGVDEDGSDMNSLTPGQLLASVNNLGGRESRDSKRKDGFSATKHAISAPIWKRGFDVRAMVIA